MADRIILHCDLNNFFASVSLLFNPTLRGLPVAVCGDQENRHGIVLAKNEEAKKYGVKTAEVIYEAQAKCPDLVILPPMMDQYREYSRKAREIYLRYTDMVEPFGIDECWLDVTGSTLLFGDGETIAHKIRRDIKRELGITISVGVSFNKAFAKLGSDMKKPDAVTVVSRENFKTTVWSLPVSVLLFAGKRTAERLHSGGIFTVGDLAACPDRVLTRLLGKNGLALKAYAAGEDTSPVEPADTVHKPKSVGRSVTRATDFTTADEVWKTFLSLSEEIAETLRRHNLYASGVQVHIRTKELAVKEFSKTYRESTNIAYVIAKRGMELFCESVSFTAPLHSVGIRAIGLKDESTAVQQDLFGHADEMQKQEILEDSLYAVRKRFGKNEIKRAVSLEKNPSKQPPEPDSGEEQQDRV